MKLPTFLVFFFLLAIHRVYTDTYSPYSPLSYVDRPCGTDLSNLWLDVVLVVDNSHGMTNEGLANVSSSILSIFGNGTRIGTNLTEHRTTRVGLITYNAEATQIADLNVLQSFFNLTNHVNSSLAEVSNSTWSFDKVGLKAAYDLLQNQSFPPNSRSHYQKVVILFASDSQAQNSEELDPYPMDYQLKDAGVKIVTVGYGNETLLERLSNISSPEYAFDGYDKGVTAKVQAALLKINCFCPPTWTQYTSSYSNSSSYHYGLCIQLMPTLTPWRTAQLNCSSYGNHSNIVTEYNKAKHDFLLEAVKNTPEFSPPYQYHIGLNLVNGTWTWDQPSNGSLPLLSWSNWILGFQEDTEATRVINIESENLKEGTTGWLNINDMKIKAGYICESYACDTDNYCLG
ncbi:hypothetical protein CRE_04221 [Caenorhabditis remanei]|uniref:C-type LECtin n=1 Tax=Caenorhabditis remanei TaxID=31234 RepID=E3MYS8_CAERE|nr:hypothetical protein CRE_04221 [Caenorhabditis remanei]